MNSRRALLTALLMCVGAPLGAQFAPGTRATSMAGAGMVFSSGIDAAELNPANLGRGGGWQVSILELGASGLFTGTTLSDFRDIIESAGDGNQPLIDGLPADGFTLESASDGFVVGSVTKALDKPGPGSPYPAVGLAVGPLALRVRSHLLTTGSISKEVADLIVTGFEEERLQEYAVRNTAFRIASYSEISLAYGLQLDRLGLGLTLRRVQGHKLTQIRLFEPEIDLNDQTFVLTGVAVESPGGSGYGVDLGMTLDMGAGLRWSMAVRDAFQRMSWDESLRTHEATYTDDDFDSADVDELIERFAPESLDPTAVSLPVYQTAQGLFDQAFFPTTVRAGLGWAGGSGTRIELVGTGVGPQGRQRSTWDERLSLGIEQQLPIITLRAGYAYGDDGLRGLAGGVQLGLGPLKVEAGVGSISGTGPGDVPYDGLHASFGLSIRGGPS